MTHKIRRPNSGRIPSLLSVFHSRTQQCPELDGMFPSAKEHFFNQRCCYTNVEKKHSQHFNGRLGKTLFFQEHFPNSAYQNPPPEWNALECNTSILFKTKSVSFLCHSMPEKSLRKLRKSQRTASFSSCSTVETVF